MNRDIRPGPPDNDITADMFRLFILATAQQHLVVATETKAYVASKWAVYILVECFHVAHR